MSTKFDRIDGPFAAKFSHLTVGEQAEYEKTYDMRQAIHKKPIAPADDGDAQKNTGKGGGFYKTLKTKEEALYNKGRISETLVLRSQGRIEQGLPIPTTIRSAAAEHKDAKAAKKIDKDRQKAADAALIAAVEAEQEEVEGAEEEDVEGADEKGYEGDNEKE